MIFPMGGVVGQAIGCICALVFAAFIIQDTGNMIKRYNYDEYIQAAAGLYLDMIDTIRLARPKPNPRTLHGDDYGARGGTWLESFSFGTYLYVGTFAVEVYNFLRK